MSKGFTLFSKACAYKRSVYQVKINVYGELWKGESGMRKKFLLLCILLNLTATGLIPLNLMLFNLPEAISVVYALLIIAATALLFIKSQKAPSCLI